MTMPSKVGTAYARSRSTQLRYLNNKFSMDIAWKSIFILQLMLCNLISIYSQSEEGYIELIKESLVEIDMKIEQSKLEVKKLIFKCEDDPFDGEVAYYYNQNKIEKVKIEYYYEGIYTAINYYLESGEIIFQEILEKMETGEYDKLTGIGEKEEELLTRIYFQSLENTSKRCIVTQSDEELVIKEHINCESFEEDYYKRVIDSFQLEAYSRVCLIYE